MSNILDYLRAQQPQGPKDQDEQEWDKIIEQMRGQGKLDQLADAIPPVESLPQMSAPDSTTLPEPPVAAQAPDIGAFLQNLQTGKASPLDSPVPANPTKQPLAMPAVDNPPPMPEPQAAPPAPPIQPEPPSGKLEQQKEIAKIKQEDTLLKYLTQLKSAQDQANKNRKLAGMLKGVDQLSQGIAGAKKRSGAYDDMKAQADQPVKDLLLQRKAKEDYLDLMAKVYQRKHGKALSPYQQAMLIQGREKLNLARQAAQQKQAKADTEQYDAVRKKVNNNRGVASAAKTVVRDFGEALKRMKDVTAKGVIPQTARKGSSYIPGTDMYEINQLIESAKSNIGIDKLLEIKASGAGLGQVPQSQLETLQSVLGRMNVGRDPELLRRDMEEARKTYEKVIERTTNENADLARMNPDIAKALGLNQKTVDKPQQIKNAQGVFELNPATGKYRKVR